MIELVEGQATWEHDIGFVEGSLAGVGFRDRSKGLILMSGQRLGM